MADVGEAGGPHPRSAGSPEPSISEGPAPGWAALITTDGRSRSGVLLILIVGSAKQAGQRQQQEQHEHGDRGCGSPQAGDVAMVAGDGGAAMGRFSVRRRRADGRSARGQRRRGKPAPDVMTASPGCRPARISTRPSRRWPVVRRCSATLPFRSATKATGGVAAECHRRLWDPRRAGRSIDGDLDAREHAGTQPRTNGESDMHDPEAGVGRGPSAQPLGHSR